MKIKLLGAAALCVLSCECMAMDRLQQGIFDPPILRDELISDAVIQGYPAPVSRAEEQRLNAEFTTLRQTVEDDQRLLEAFGQVAAAVYRRYDNLGAQNAQAFGPILRDLEAYSVPGPEEMLSETFSANVQMGPKGMSSVRADILARF